MTARQSRHKQILALCSLLLLLVGGIAYVIIPPAVPLVQFVIVSEDSFTSDTTHVTQLPPGSTAVNASRLLKVAQRLHDLEPKQLNKPVQFDSASELVDATPDSGNKLLIVYLTSAATLVPEDAKDGPVIVQLVPADAAKKLMPFKRLLTSLRQSGSKRTVLLLELTGRNPALASGILTDDFRSHIEAELLAENVPGLTVICACGKDERSWEFFRDKPPATADASQKPASDSAVASRLTLPEFDGTVFGHFLVSAFEEGKAENAESLFTYVSQQVNDWVENHYGSSQTVWLASSDKSSKQSKLLTSIRLPEELESKEDTNAATVAASATESQQSPDSKKDSASADSGAGTETTVIDDSPVALLKLRTEERDQLAAATTPVRFSAEWLRLQMHMISAERFALNGNHSEFNRIHDEILKKSLNQLKGQENAAISPELRAIREWLVMSDDAAGAGQFTQILQDFGVEPGKTPPLPKEFQSSGPARQTFAIELGQELKSLRQTIDTMSQADRKKRIQQLAFLLENIAEKGWRLDQFPESMATVKEVLHTRELDPDGLSFKPLVRLLEIRKSSLRLAAGYGSDNLRLRQATWDDYDLAKELNGILIKLNSAERWLCAGPDAIALAEDRMEQAEKSQDILRDRVDAAQALSQVQDAQKLELPFLIEYLALRQETTSLPPTELKSARRMAESAINGTLKFDEFPAGQLEPIGFSRDHLAAMFDLTRIFSSETHVSAADKLHLDRLREYVNSRSRQSISATERLQLISIPQFSERGNVLSLLQQKPMIGIDRKADPSSHSGIWLSFWSLRLIDAISGEVQNADWEKWKALVSAIDEGRHTDVSASRTQMAIALQNRWSAAMEKLKAENAPDVFVSQKDVIDILAKEVTRRNQTSVNRSLFSSISQTTKAAESDPNAFDLTVSSPAVASSPDGSFEIPVTVRNLSGLYLRNDSFTVLNTEKQSQHDWSVLPVSPADGSEQKVTLRLQSNSKLTSPVTVNLIGINSDGAAVKSGQVLIQPSSENEWRIEVVQVQAGKTTEQPVTLPDGKSRSESVLPLPPSTLDHAKNEHVPVLLKLRLRRVKGVAARVLVQIRPVDRQKAIWAKMELSFSPGESLVTVPFGTPATAGDAAAAAAATPPPAAKVPEIDVSEGIVFEITPLDLPQQIVSSLTVYPRLHSPEDIFEIPSPVYDHSSAKLTLNLARKNLNDSTKIWPTQFPGELVLSPALSKFYRSGTLIAPNADGFEFQPQFHQDIEKTVGNAHLEFGVSLAGVQHAWWWRLTDSTQPDLVKNEIRSSLVVENDKEVVPVATVPALLVGAGWRKANLRSQIFLHGIRIDREHYLSVRIGSAGSDGSTLATDRPILVNRRFAESVTVASGEEGVWKVSTISKPWGIPTFTPETFRLQDGRHEFIASLRTSDPSSEPIETSVPFVLDETPPVINANSIELKSSPVLVTGSLKGRVTVSDLESGVTTIRVGLKVGNLEELKFTPDTKIVEDFELDSLGFPKIEQKETRTEDYGTLIVEVVNGVGLSKKETQRVKFFRPGKAVAMKEEPKQPGSIKVTFSIAAVFTVSVSGPDGYMEEKSGMSQVVFENVPPGSCTVKWKPKQGTAGSGAKTVVVSSGKPATVKGN